MNSDLRRGLARAAQSPLWTLRALGLLGLLGLTACADGFPGPEHLREQMALVPFDSLGGAGGGAGPLSGSSGSAGSAGMAGMVAPELPMFMGEACTMGERPMCPCEDGVSQGTRTCTHDPLSPTLGSLSPCKGCPPAGAPTTGGASGGGTGGSGGAAGARAGAGGMGGNSAGSGGSGGSGDEPSAGSGSMGCDEDDCPEPLFGSACCTRDDECGSRLLLSCNAN